MWLLSEKIGLKDSDWQNKCDFCNIFQVFGCFCLWFNIFENATGKFLQAIYSIGFSLKKKKKEGIGISLR